MAVLIRRGGGCGFSKRGYTKKESFLLRLYGNFRSFLCTQNKIWYHFFPLLFPKDSKNRRKKKFGHWTSGSGGKKTFKGYLTKMYVGLYGQTDILILMANSLKKEKNVFTYWKKIFRGSDKVWIFQKGCVSTRRDCHQPGYTVLLL